MTPPKLRLLFGTAVIAAAACSALPRQAAVPAPAAVSAPGTIDTRSTPESPGVVSAQLLAVARDAGYRPKVVDGKAYFCKTETPTGELISRTFCINRTQMEILGQEAKNERERMRQQAPEAVKGPP